MVKAYKDEDGCNNNDARDSANAKMAELWQQAGERQHVVLVLNAIDCKAYLGCRGHSPAPQDGSHDGEGWDEGPEGAGDGGVAGIEG